MEAVGSGNGPVVLGITFILITLRVGLGLGHETTLATASVRSAKASSSVTSERWRHRREDIRTPPEIQLTVIDIIKRETEDDIEECSIAVGTKGPRTLTQDYQDMSEGAV